MAVESGQNATWRPKKSARVKRFSEDDKLAQTLEKLSFSCPLPSGLLHETYSTNSNRSKSDKANRSKTNDRVKNDISKFNFVYMNALIPDAVKSAGTQGITRGARDIGHAPLISESIVIRHADELLPQYGFLGCLREDDSQVGHVKIFQNTNVPFSSFICGVQGSGKSHTTATMLENALIPSKHLGRLEAPAAALVFSYGDWVDGGAGFEISEAKYLVNPNPVFPTARVKSVTVLVSPSNPAIKRSYEGPGVKVIPFKLNAKSLDISTLLTLMGVDEKATVPLYMAKVEAMLRHIATNSKDGSLDYKLFKQMLAKERFDGTQQNMLDMRLNLLESFLDLTGQAVEPDFLPGEITIMDFSDSFIAPTTACVLFKLGLDRFLRSTSSTAKVVLLDEAHKYMLDTPGSTLLSNRLATTIRLQRHMGVRVIISTQEPTVSTDLIALCSVTVMHRFTSPAWYSALKKHIGVLGGEDKTIMRQIEELETGEALVYAPSAALGKDDDGTLIKATGRLMRLNIRKRVTTDGGESVMAV